MKVRYQHLTPMCLKQHIPILVTLPKIWNLNFSFPIPSFSTYHFGFLLPYSCLICYTIYKVNLFSVSGGVFLFLCVCVNLFFAIIFIRNVLSEHYSCLETCTLKCYLLDCTAYHRMLACIFFLPICNV